MNLFCVRGIFVLSFCSQTDSGYVGYVLET